MEPAEQIPETVEQFEQALRTQARLYGSLLDLAKKQAQEISAENLEAVLRLLEEKRQVIEEIGAVGASGQQLQDFWEEHKEAVSEDIQERIRTVVDEIRRTLEELLKIEAKSQDELGSAKTAIEDQIAQLNIGPKAMHSYQGKGDSAPRFMDKTG